ncbi:hypothetical protein [Fontivita pretiosa]|uniref:hypothetical protein n=1 Tax=Fontivita pretiosa TaxID=2989684 RepID=UPI003D16C70A
MTARRSFAARIVSVPKLPDAGVARPGDRNAWTAAAVYAVCTTLLAGGCVSSARPDRRAAQPQKDTPRAVGETSSQPAEHGKQDQSAGEAIQQRSAPTGGVDQMDANAGSAEALARKAQEYSRQLTLMLSRRSGASGTTREPSPSRVEWMDPSAFSLGGSETPTLRTIADEQGSTGSVRADAPQAAQPPDSRDRSAVALAGSSAKRPVFIEPTSSLPQAPAASGSLNELPAAGELSEKFSRRIKDYPRDVSAHLDYQLLQFLLDQPAPQLSALSSLPSEDRELITALIDGLSNFRNALRADRNMLLSRKIKPLLDVAERLRSQADLTIPTIALCTKVQGFGNYDPIEPARFAAGREHPAIVYCEIANFTSHLNDRQQWETRLTWDMTLYTEQGMSVWTDKTEQITDSSRNRRHDFFVRKVIKLPGTLTIGRYVLKVSIVDTQSNRVAEASVPIVIAAQ